MNRPPRVYSRFCQLFREFGRRLSPTMRSSHVAGHKAFVDYSGKQVSITDPVTGEVRSAKIFVAVLGAPSLTYAEVTWTQTLPDWIAAHVRMFRFWGVAPRLLVPDNLKSAIHRASFYDPEVNRSYGMMAAHYGVGILPARPKRPREKAAVEAGVRFAQSYILGRLRNVTFFSLAEANAAVVTAVERINSREMRRLGMSRRQLFEAIEQPVMQELPQGDFEYAEWHLARVGSDYHVEVQGLFYSVPHALIREQVDTRATQRTVEVFQPRQARRRTCPSLWRPASRHSYRAHAECAPALRRVDAGASATRRPQHRARHRGADHRRDGAAATSRAGLPHLPRDSAAVPRPGGQSGRRSQQPGGRDRRAVLRLSRLDPEAPARPSVTAATRSASTSPAAKRMIWSVPTTCYRAGTWAVAPVLMRLLSRPGTNDPSRWNSRESRPGPVREGGVSLSTGRCSWMGVRSNP